MQTTMTPLQQLESLFSNKKQAIVEWFNEQWRLTPPPLYGSIDLRNANFKIAPIDMNLFPAGFNNLNPEFLPYAITVAKQTIADTVPQAKKILLIPESHTRNQAYWENILTLKTILEKADFEIVLTKLESTTEEVVELEGMHLVLKPMTRVNDKLQVGTFIPDFILLNNDLSAGIPAILEGLAQPLLPPAELGWSQRLKSDYFQYYAEVAQDFATTFQIDPWLISPLFRHCGEVDFMQQAGLDCLRRDSEELFAAIQKKYDEYKIEAQPFLIIKADAGTYGMAVMTVRKLEELESLNRKQRTRMSTTKGGQPVRRVIIQEGVYTFETLGAEAAVAEPVLYLLGDKVIGGFYRVHKERGIDENLNAPGMQFEPIAFSQPCNEATCQSHLYLYCVIAKLGMLAAAREMRNT